VRRVGIEVTPAGCSNAAVYTSPIAYAHSHGKNGRMELEQPFLVELARRCSEFELLVWQNKHETILLSPHCAHRHRIFERNHALPSDQWVIGRPGGYIGISASLQSRTERILAWIYVYRHRSGV
jgi:hypothetical protein